MRFLVDACAGTGLATWLKDHGHDSALVGPDHVGLPDPLVLAWAHRENRVLVTCDKDFGELVYRQAQTHAGIILLRLEDERVANKCAIMAALLAQVDASRLHHAFTTVTESTIRITHHP